MALLLVILKAIIEIAALALLARFIVGIFNWGRRQDNFVYQLLALVTKPFVSAVRLVTPRMVVDQHIPLATFLVLVFAWLVVLFQLDRQCHADPGQAGCEKVQRQQR